jgi:hypothetical protein
MDQPLPTGVLVLRNGQQIPRGGQIPVTYHADGIDNQ